MGNSSANSSLGGFIENLPQNIYRGLEQRGFIMSRSQNQQTNSSGARVNQSSSQANENGQRMRGGGPAGMNQSNQSGSLESLMHSIGGSSLHQNVISSQQYTTLFGGASTNTLGTNNNNQRSGNNNQNTALFTQNNPFLQATQPSHLLSSATQRRHALGQEANEVDYSSNIFDFRNPNGSPP